MIPPRFHAPGFIAILLFIITGCSSYDLPPVRESEEKIALSRARSLETDRSIDLVGAMVVLEHDLALRVRRTAFNAILDPLVRNRSDDVRIVFNGNRPWIEEEKSFLGIRYRNYLNIDGGAVNLNLTELRFVSFEKNVLTALIRMEGNGAISVSGKYAGIPAASTPDMELGLRDTIAFTLAITDTGSIILKPVPKKLSLRVKFLVKLLEWRVPWNEVIPLEIGDLITPVEIPSTISSMIPFPTLAQDPKESYGVVTRKLLVRDAVISAVNQVLDWRCNIEFGK